jgi:hypothetical protein
MAEMIIECRKKRKERAPGEARKRREKIKTTHGGIKRQFL